MDINQIDEADARVTSKGPNTVTRTIRIHDRKIACWRWLRARKTLAFMTYPRYAVLIIMCGAHHLNFNISKTSVSCIENETSTLIIDILSQLMSFQVCHGSREETGKKVRRRRIWLNLVGSTCYFQPIIIMPCFCLLNYVTTIIIPNSLTLVD